MTNPEDWEKTAEIGLTRPLKDYIAKPTEVIKHRPGTGGELAMCHGTVALNNSTAIELFSPPELMLKHTFDDWFCGWRSEDAIYI